MASSSSNSVSEPAKIKQVIAEFFAKSHHIILEARSPCICSRKQNTSQSDKWFNPSQRENNFDPLVIDILLTEDNSVKVIERWFVRYESHHRGSSHSLKTSSMYKKIYEYTKILLLSLHATLRFLPAHKVYHDLKYSSRVYTFSLSHKMSSFAEPFIRAEEAGMKHFSFVPVDTYCGRLSLSVVYVATLKYSSTEDVVSVPRRYITDYVGSPEVERFKSLDYLPGSLPGHVSHNRRHSWTIDHAITPTYSDTNTIQCDCNPYFPHCSEPSPTQTKNATSHEYLPLPPLSHGLKVSRGSADIHSGKCSQADTHRARLSTASSCPTSPLGRRSKIKKRLGEVFSGMNLQKMLYSRKDEAGNQSGGNMKISVLDEFEDSEFVYPFAGNNEYMRDIRRIEASGAYSNDGHEDTRSTDAAVGVLLQMLKTALPLRQNITIQVISSQVYEDEYSAMKGVQHNKSEDIVEKSASSSMSTASGSIKLKSSADATGELRRYVKIKEAILSKRGNQDFNIGQARKSLSEITEDGGSSLTDRGQSDKSVFEGTEVELHPLVIRQAKK